MCHERNACAHDCLNLRDVAEAAFEFHPFRSDIPQRSRRFQRLFRRVVGMDRHVGDKQRALYSSPNGPGVMQHFIERHLSRILVTKHNHSD